MQFLFAPVLGRLSDERGRRPILLLSLFGSVVAWTLFGRRRKPRRPLRRPNARGRDGRQHRHGTGVHRRHHAAGGPGEGVGTHRRGVRTRVRVRPGARRCLLQRRRALRRSGRPFPRSFPSPSSPCRVSPPRPSAALNLVVAAFVLPETRTKRTTARSRRTNRQSRLARLAAAFSNPALAGLVASFFLLSFAFSSMESMFVLFTEQQYGFGPR